MTRWICKVCRTWGVGGPGAWNKHYAAEHRHDGRYNAQLSFGFAPNYSNGWRTNHWSDYRPQPRCEEKP
ncbi:MAG: hypothetical protein EB127_29530 [Alphaproteobacteria bacterium]|nr:hypothetical protein [Alphaproteobacteria bacterium]